MADDILRNDVMKILIDKHPLTPETLEKGNTGLARESKVVKEEKEHGDKLLEQLAAIEHDQWMHWAEDILRTEKIGKERTERWQALFVPYTELSEEMKESDRKWAKKILEVTGKGGGKTKESITGKPKDSNVLLEEVFKKQSEAAVIEDLDSTDIEDDIRTSLGRNIRTDIFEAMF